MVIMLKEDMDYLSQVVLYELLIMRFLRIVDFKQWLQRGYKVVYIKMENISIININYFLASKQSINIHSRDFIEQPLTPYRHQEPVAFVKS